MKNNRKLLILTTAALLLASCGTGNSKSSNPIDSGTSLPESSLSSASSNPTSEENSSSTSRRPIGGGSSSKSSSSTPSSQNPSSSSKTSSSVDTSDDIPVRYSIILHADKDNEGLKVSAPSSALSGSKVTLTVELPDGYVLEYIRLYATTTAEGGVRVKPDAEGKYTFEMPAKNIDVYYKGVKGYGVTFAGNHATAKLAADSEEYNLWGVGYPVYVCKNTVDSGYYFKGFEVRDAKGTLINTWNDAPDQVGFLMPASNVTVTAIGEKIDESLATIAGTYTNGVQIDMNSIGDDTFEIVIGLDKKIKFVSDWTNKDWIGTYTYANNQLDADVTNMTQDGYYTDTTRHLRLNFLENGKYIAAEFSSETATYRYMFGKTSEGLMAKKLYMSKLSDGDYTRSHRIVSFSALSGDFFTYVNPTRTSAEYRLFAYEKGTNNQVGAFTKDKTYTMKKPDGTAFIEVSYDGSNITVAQPQAENPGPGGDTGDTKTAPFLNKTYRNKNIRIYDDDWYDYDTYIFDIKFSSTFGLIDYVSIAAEPGSWSPLLTEKRATDLTYTFDEESGDISVVGLKSGSQITTLTYLENGSIKYNGKMWFTDGWNASNNKDCILTVVE